MSEAPPNGWQHLRRALWKRKFTILLIALLLITLVPLLSADGADPRGAVEAGNRIHGLLWAFMLLAAVHAVADRSRTAVIFSVAALIVFSGRIASVFGPRFALQDQIDAGSYSTSALFLAATIFMLYRAILRSPRVEFDTVMGAVCVYLLIGFTWSNFYALVHITDNGAFNFPDYVPMDQGTIVPEYTFGYYSFVTLTTLGYGDITPITYAARTLSWLEAVVGVSYMATVIAFLVSQVVVDKERGDEI